MNECRALILYQKPNVLSFGEQLIVAECHRRNDYIRMFWVYQGAHMRASAIALMQFGRSDSNYSSARYDMQYFDSMIRKYR